MAKRTAVEKRSDKAECERAKNLLVAAYAAGNQDEAMACSVGTTANTIYRYRKGMMPVTPFMARKIVKALS